MKKLIVLGTGNAQAIYCYNTCFAMTSDDQEYFLTDAGGGNGILLCLEKANIPLTKIHHIFVSHAHNDHILGMVWMIRMIATAMNKDQYQGNLTIYCHRELVETIKTLTSLTVGKKFTRYFDDRILFDVVEDGSSREILGDHFTFFDIRSTKQKQFGYTLLNQQNQKIIFMGDEPYRDYLLSYAANSDWLLHEAFCTYDQRERFQPYEKHHSTVMDAAKLAASLQIPNLVLWHTEDKTLATRSSAYLAEGKAYYQGNLYVPEDGTVIPFLS